MIIDLHADILSYLAEDPAHSPYDSAVRASANDLQKGGVGLQVLPIFCPTIKQATEFGQKQVKIYKSLTTTYPEAFGQNKIQILPSIENLSSFFEEEEPLEQGFERLT